MPTPLTTFIKETPADSLYLLVQWPWVQELMEYNWFRKECLLHHAFDDQEYLDSAYFVPVKRMHEYQSGDKTNFIQNEEESYS
ncbi:hypothetical protein [Mucilaginibacter sp.]|uniref:hypothetical protein n=1 Tax=Mucilaginibacter sp. TaxID=1882438 RepID=UPI0035BBDC8B